MAGIPGVTDVEIDPARVFGAVPRPDALERARIGRRARSLVSRRTGKYSRHRLARRDSTDLALDATIRAAAARQRGGSRLAVEVQDLRRKVRAHRSPFAVCFVVDNSYSVHAEHMVEKVKGLALRLLADAAHRGDKVALVAFKGGVPEATVAVPPTASLSLAYRRLKEIPLSGRTPLPDALVKARRLLRRETFKHPNAIPVVVVITDGLPTVALRPGGDPLTDTLAEALRLRRQKVFCIVADVAPPGSGIPSCGAELARVSGGVWLAFDELEAETMARLLAGVEGVA